MISEADIQGHWVREWIKTPNFEDHTTRVHWMQVGQNYADMRIPYDRPVLSGASALSDLSAKDLSLLARAEGFAGIVTLEGDNCTWHRAINWHGTPDAADVGAISFDADGKMIEAGVLADYAELWLPKTGSTSFVQFSGQGYMGFCARVGNRSVVGIGQPEKPATRRVVDALAKNQISEGVDTLFDGLHAYGHWHGSDFIADLSTNPFTETQAVLTMSEFEITWHRTDFFGEKSEIRLRIET